MSQYQPCIPKNIMSYEALSIPQGKALEMSPCHYEWFTFGGLCKADPTLERSYINVVTETSIIH